MAIKEAKKIARKIQKKSIVYLQNIYTQTMAEFRKWLEANTLGTDEVESRIDQIYDKAKYAIKIVQMYVKAKSPNDPERNLLKNISTVAPLNSGVYGLYNSAENKAVIGPAAASKIRFKFGNDVVRQQNNLQKLPATVISQYLPDVDARHITPSDVIHVNVQKIVRELGDTIEAVLEIASTIVHEATHEMEYRQDGKTGEGGPKAAEARFMLWAKANINSIISSIPQLKSFQQTTFSSALPTNHAPIQGYKIQTGSKVG